MVMVVAVAVAVVVVVRRGAGGAGVAPKWAPHHQPTSPTPPSSSPHPLPPPPSSPPPRTPILPQNPSPDPPPPPLPSPTRTPHNPSTSPDTPFSPLPLPSPPPPPPPRTLTPPPPTPSPPLSSSQTTPPGGHVEGRESGGVGVVEIGAGIGEEFDAGRGSEAGDEVERGAARGVDRVNGSLRGGLGEVLESGGFGFSGGCPPGGFEFGDDVGGDVGGRDPGRVRRSCSRRRRWGWVRVGLWVLDGAERWSEAAAALMEREGVGREEGWCWSRGEGEFEAGEVGFDGEGSHGVWGCVYKYPCTLMAHTRAVCISYRGSSEMLHEDCITWNCDGAVSLQPKLFFRCLKELSEGIFLKMMPTNVDGSLAWFLTGHKQDLTGEPADVSETLDSQGIVSYQVLFIMHIKRSENDQLKETHRTCKKVESCSVSSMAEKGHFVVYSVDGRRFEIPLTYLQNQIVAEFLQAAEEEFGPARDEPITLPCNGVLLEYALSLIRRRVCEDMQKVLAVYIANGRCSSYSELVQEQSTQYQTTICSY
ncbi:Auxin-responsive protein SAUR67-like protein [Drosera capensis]